MNCKRWIACVLIFALCFMMLPVSVFAAEEVASGTCGDQLTWVLDSEGTLTISGTGDMDHFSVWPVWDDYRSSIVNVVIEEGVTSIGNFAFTNHVDIQSIRMPSTLTKIGNYAFQFCEGLTQITIPASVTYIGKEAFGWCHGLQGVYITDLSAWLRINYGDEYGIPLRWGGENKLYLNGEVLTHVTIPEGITEIGPYALCSRGIESIIVPNGVTKIGDFAFAYCASLVDIQLPNSLTSIGKSAFYECDALQHIALPGSLTSLPEGLFLNCDNLTEIGIPASVTDIGNRAFSACKSLQSITLPGGITRIPELLFGGCTKLSSIRIPEGVTIIEQQAFDQCMFLKDITIPASVGAIDQNAFGLCLSLKDVYYDGTAAQWENLLKNVQSGNEDLLEANIHIGGNPMIVYSDTNKLRLQIGQTITLSAGIWIDDETKADPGSITFQLADGYALKILDTGISDGCLYVKFQGVMEGITSVTFNDTATGKTVTVPITVTGVNYNAFTIETVPEFTVKTGPIVEGPLNFYNHNGLYIDSYHAVVADSGITTVNFDVYNTNHTYAIVEVYDENGKLKDAVIIDKMNHFNDSIKNVLWDGTACLIRDIASGNALSYKQELNFSKHTSVRIEIPKNGYIRITANSMESDILAVINCADLWMAALAVTKKVQNYKGLDFAQKLTEQLVYDDSYLQMAKADENLAKKIMKGFSKDLFVSSESLGEFTTSIYNNLTELNLLDIILDSAASTGQGILEEGLKEAMGGIGDALDAVFLIGEIEDVVCQFISFSGTDDGGVITIQNQGGGKRHCDNIVLESEVDFDPETALQVFSVTLSEELLEKVKNADPETYELLTTGIMHTYNISLVKHGEETQHSGDVAVYIPIPEDLVALGLSGHIKVYRIEEDGSVTDMDAAVVGDYIVFTTDHFSLYTLVGYEQMPDTPSDPGQTPSDTKPNENTQDPEQPDSKPAPSDETSGSVIGRVVLVFVIVVVILAGGCTVLVLINKKRNT